MLDNSYCKNIKMANIGDGNTKSNNYFLLYKTCLTLLGPAVASRKEVIKDENAFGISAETNKRICCSKLWLFGNTTLRSCENILV